MHPTFSNAEQYFKETIHLFGCNDDPLETEEELVLLTTGVHTFPFHYQSSSSLPMSFEGKFGHIRYQVTAVLDILSDDSITVVKPFYIVMAMS